VETRSVFFLSNLLPVSTVFSQQHSVMESNLSNGLSFVGRIEIHVDLCTMCISHDLHFHG
jgi:hypothetical protein